MPPSLPAVWQPWGLVSLSPWPPGWLALATALLWGAALWVVYGYRHSPQRLWLSFLRLASALLLSGFVWQPACQRQLQQPLPSRIAVVLDRSASMNVGASPGMTGATSRHAAVQAWLAASQAARAALAPQYSLSYHDLQAPLTEATLLQPSLANGSSSDLLRACEQAAQTSGSTALPLAALLLVSDGADTGMLEAPWNAVQQRAQQLQVPINVLPLTDRQPFRDVALSDLQVDRWAFVHNTVSLTAQLSSRGYDALELPVTLSQDGQKLSTQLVNLAAEGNTTLRWQSKPSRVGSTVYSLTVPVQAAESVTVNNHTDVQVQVLRDKTRILHVAGRPSWEERFLRQTLQQNRNFDVVSFFILRTPADDTSIPEAQLALIPFPVNKLFTSELRSFDVVILQNFDFRPYGMTQYLGDIRSAVEQAGLGLLVLGGADSLSDGGYGGTPLEALLPVRLNPAATLPQWRPEPVVPLLSAAGEAHPVTQFNLEAPHNAALWQSLPAWSGANALAGLQPNASALLVAATQRASDGSPLPLLATLDVGKGRSATLASDSLWRWRFHSPQQSGALASRLYAQLWTNLLRWLVHDPQQARLQLHLEPTPLQLGTAATLQVELRGHHYEPLVATSLHVRLTAFNNPATPPPAPSTLQTDSQGKAQLRWDALAAGVYRVQVNVAPNAALPAELAAPVSQMFVVEDRPLEQLHSQAQPQWLTKLADSSGGAVLPLQPSAWTQLHLKTPPAAAVAAPQSVTLWDNAWALGLALLCWGSEWALRRRLGHL